MTNGGGGRRVKAKHVVAAPPPESLPFHDALHRFEQIHDLLNEQQPWGIESAAVEPPVADRVPPVGGLSAVAPPAVAGGASSGGASSGGASSGGASSGGASSGGSSSGGASSGGASRAVRSARAEEAYRSLLALAEKPTAATGGRAEGVADDSSLELGLQEAFSKAAGGEPTAVD